MNKTYIANHGGVPYSFILKKSSGDSPTYTIDCVITITPENIHLIRHVASQAEELSGAGDLRFASGDRTLRLTKTEDGEMDGVAGLEGEGEFHFSFVFYMVFFWRHLDVIQQLKDSEQERISDEGTVIEMEDVLVFEEIGLFGLDIGI